jgi:hypothetical protein
MSQRTKQNPIAHAPSKAILVLTCLASALAIVRSVDAATPTTNRTISVLEATASDGSAPVNVLAIVPLNQGADATLAICNALVGTLPAMPSFKYSCRNGTMDDIARTSTKLPLKNPGEKGVVAVLHVTEASGRRNDIDAFEILNVAGFLPEGGTMRVCEGVAHSAGNRTAGSMSDVHYTCEVDNNQ